MKYSLISICLCALFLIGSCSKEYTSQPKPHAAPDTYLSLRPDSSLRRTTSQQHIHWWGIAPDGLVIGYFISVDSVHWNFTTANDSIFSLRLNTIDTTYTFFVSAVNNYGNGKYDSQTPWGSEPFTDLNGNGKWDVGEPYVDIGDVDPTPASLKYPISNTPPKVAFVLKSDVPETTYTVATFQWTGSDLDGIETITNYYYAIDDTLNTTSWKELPGSASNVTLFKKDGLNEGKHIFYLRAKDVAGALSPTVRMPDTTKTWYVREPKGDFLIVNDIQFIDPQAPAEKIYKQILDTLLSGRLGSKDILNIKIGSSATSRGKFVPALINPTFTETLKLFKYVFWFGDNTPSLEIAQTSIPDFLKAGGKVFFCSGFPENVSGQGSLVDFAPIQNVESGFFVQRLNAKDSLLAAQDISYPTLMRDTLGSIYTFPRGIIPKIDADIIYQMQSSSRWTGQPVMGVRGKDPSTQKPNFILVAALLHRFGTPPNNLAALFRKVFADEFGVQ
ncbi:MAG: hypothetical protein PHP42_06440 [Bacteroidota bacterium]|nr:hypothetical protein [Bacteroidota bacterium]